MESNANEKFILTQLKNFSGENISSLLDLPESTTVEDLCSILCQVDPNYSNDNEYSFTINNIKIANNLRESLEILNFINTEKVIEVVCSGSSRFRVRSVTRCSSTLSNHSHAIVSLSFSPDAINLATGSGDTTIQLYDLMTESPKFTLKGHKNWVLVLAWSPDAKKLASGCKDGIIMIWNPTDGSNMGKPLIGHKQYISDIVWKPMHLDEKCQNLISCSKDGSIILWNSFSCSKIRVLSQHTKSVTCLRWAANDFIISCSQDRTICVWKEDSTTPFKKLVGHAHWVNYLALSSDYAIRSGPFDYKIINFYKKEEQLSNAKERIEKFLKDERLVSCSDDFTMFLWKPFYDDNNKPIARLTGHQGPINHVLFSPNGDFISSASFDKSIKIWDGTTGKYINSLRGHIHNVYRLSYSPDSELLCSCSADSTVKIWDYKNAKLLFNLPGHADQVYVLDWSPSGEHVASGGKDAKLKIWRP